MRLRLAIFSLLVSFTFPLTSWSEDGLGYSKFFLNNFTLEKQLWIYKNLPKLFPLTGICQATEEGSTKKLVVFPGATVEFKNKDGQIKCGKSLTVLLKAQSKIRVIETGVVPSFSELEGAAYFRIGKNRFGIITDGATFNTTGERETNYLFWKKMGSSDVISCQSGEVTSQIAIRVPEQVKTKLLSYMCKWSARSEELRYNSIFWQGESFHLLDLMANKKFRDLGLSRNQTSHDIPPSLVERSKITNFLSAPPKFLDKDRIEVDVTLIPPQSACELWSSEEKSFSEAKILKQFESTKDKIVIQLQPPLKPNLNLGLFCESKDGFWVSGHYSPPPTMSENK